MADFDMTVDGKKIKLSEKMATAQGSREKKIAVEVNGRIIRVMPHMLADVKKFGGSEQRRVIKEPPKELLSPLPLPKKLILPRTEPVKSEIIPAVKPEPASYPGDEVKVAIPPVDPLVVKPVIAPGVPTPKPAVKKAVRKPAAKKK